MGELEAEVLAVLWDAHGWLTPGAVRERLQSTPEVSYSTIMTVLRRLWKKQLLDRRRAGRAYEYTPVRGHEEFTAARMADLLTAAHDPVAALGHFVAELDEQQRTELRRMLEGRDS